MTTPACTSACTGEAENAHESSPERTASLTADALAALILQLPPDERARLAALVNAKEGGSDAR
jgi:hypothetical protein